MIYTSIFFWAFVLYFFYRFLKQEEDEFRVYAITGLISRILAGFALGIVYSSWYHTGDTWYYFTITQNLITAKVNPFGDINLVADTASILESQTRIIWMLRFTWLVNWVSFGSYWVVSMFYSVISFISFWYFFKVLSSAYPARKFVLFIALFLWPSVIFWSSGLSKESLALASMAYLAASIWKGKSWRWYHVLWAVLSLLILWELRYFYFILFVPFVLLLLFFQFFQPTVKKIAAIITGIGLLTLTISYLHPNLHYSRISEVIITHYNDFISISKQENIIQLGEIKTTMDMIKNVPSALFQGLTRPYLWEAGTWPKKIAALDTILLVGLLFYHLLKRKRIKLDIVLILVFAMLLLTILTISVPNIGSLVRYRVAVWWILAIFALWDIKFLSKSQDE